ncbi:hypothetical protein KUW17_10965 [Leisingera aquaemixtae]|uniref:hypothetical protein n=1 Tax=Leisingera aquaemixtae TaxID=1396826 RepID=UPI001C97A590|nr:hypothetical protein [Leisingera aquaemixtae]MBY6067262.1 hypothetical protein [Leisingera aquaemixtae]
MKTIVHIGMPKAGSTVLQDTLFLERDTLLANGALYPDPGLNKIYNHGLLAGAVLPYEDGPRVYRRVSEQEHAERVEGFLERLQRQVKEVRPAVLILSSEYLWRLDEPQMLAKLQSLLARLGAGDIEFLAYVRRPSAFFLSAAQQSLRASTHLYPAESLDFSHVLDAYAKAFPKARITVRLFDRASLAGGDVVTDFASLYFPECLEAVQQAARKVSGNETLSAEGMALLQAFRHNFFADRNDVFTKETARFRERLCQLDEDHAAPRPVLRPELRDYFDFGNAMALTLRDQYGVTFPDFDYPRLERGDFAPPPELGSAVRDVVTIDDDRLYRMIVALREEPLLGNLGLARWLISLPHELKLPQERGLLGWVSRCLWQAKAVRFKRAKHSRKQTGKQQ